LDGGEETIFFLEDQTTMFLMEVQVTTSLIAIKA
jgi:hypothetical protein